MNRRFVSVAIISFAVGGGVNFAKATSVPFTEDFTSNVANWGDTAGTALLTHVVSGGPDGGAYASTSFNVAGLGGGSATLFRAHPEFNSSGHAFEGNWITDGVGKITAMVRHNAPQPLTYYGRFAILTANSPAAIGIQFAPVPPQTWTQLSFAIAPGNPQYVTYEGSNFNTVFSQVGRVQFGIDVPAALNGATTPYTFDIDKVTLVPTPEPAGALLMVMVALTGTLWRRCR